MQWGQRWRSRASHSRAARPISPIAKAHVEGRHAGQQDRKLGGGIAHRPQRTCVRGGARYRRILEHTLFQHAGEEFVELRGLAHRIGAGTLHQHVHGMAPGQRRTKSLDLAQHEIQVAGPHHLECRDATRQFRLRALQQDGHGVVVRQAAPRGRNGFRLRVQFQDDAGDDPQRSLSPGQQVAQVVARVVLDHLVQAADYAAVGEHGLDAD